MSPLNFSFFSPQVERTKRKKMGEGGVRDGHNNHKHLCLKKMNNKKIENTKRTTINQ